MPAMGSTEACLPRLFFSRPPKPVCARPGHPAPRILLRTVGKLAFPHAAVGRPAVDRAPRPGPVACSPKATAPWPERHPKTRDALAVSVDKRVDVRGFDAGPQLGQRTGLPTPGRSGARVASGWVAAGGVMPVTGTPPKSPYRTCRCAAVKPECRSAQHAVMLQDRDEGPWWAAPIST